MLVTHLVPRDICVCESIAHNEFVFREIVGIYYVLGTVGDKKRIDRTFYSLIHSFSQCPLGACRLLSTGDTTPFSVGETDIQSQ